MPQFLSNINLTQNQLENLVLHTLPADPTVGSSVNGQVYYNSANSVIRYFNGSAWIDLAQSVGGGTVDSIIQGAGITVTASGNDYTVSHADTSTVADVDTSNAQVIDTITFDTFGHITAITTRNMTLANLGYTGSPTADNYSNWNATGDTGSTSVASGNTLNFGGNDGITTTASAGLVRIDVDNTVVRTSGAQSIAGAKTFTDDVVVNANFTVTGNVTSTVSEIVKIEDALLLLNSNYPAALPTADAGIVINRGTGGGGNVAWMWDESADVWTAQYVGAEAGNTDGNVTLAGACDISVGGANFAGNTIATGTITGSIPAGLADNPIVISNSGKLETRTAAQIKAYIGAGSGSVTSVAATASNGITVTGSPITTSGTLTITGSNASTSAKGVVELATAGNATAGAGNFEALEMTSTTTVVTPAGLKSLRYSTSIGNGASTAYTITHNLGTRDVMIEMYDTATYTTVYADFVRATTNTVTVTFSSAPSTNAYKVLIIAI